MRKVVTKKNGLCVVVNTDVLLWKVLNVALFEDYPIYTKEDRPRLNAAFCDALVASNIIAFKPTRFFRDEKRWKRSLIKPNLIAIPIRKYGPLKEILREFVVM